MRLIQILWIFVILILVPGCQKKQEAEQQVDIAATERQETVAITDVSSFSYACLPYTGSYENHETVIGAFVEAASAQGFAMTESLFGVYYNNPEDTPADSLVWEIGFEVPDSLEVSAPLVVKKWLFTRVARAIHTGPYETVAQTYPKIFEFIDKQNMMPAGPIMERFLSDPQQIASEELKTEIWVPVSGGEM